MKNFTLLLFILILTTLGFNKMNNFGNSEVYRTVLTNSTVKWKAWHLGKIGERFGTVSIKNGEVYTEKNKITSGTFILDIENLSVENFKEDNEKNEKLKGHLKSSDFFATDSFPNATFVITRTKSIMGSYNTLVEGKLKIKNKTHPIQFKANFVIAKNRLTLNSETFEIDRGDWGLVYHSKGSMGVHANYLIADEIEFKIRLSMEK